MYIKLSDQTYPVGEWEIRLANPNVSYPTPMPSAVPGYQLVAPSVWPAFNANTQTVVEIQPIQVLGEWTQQWQVIALPSNVAAEKAALGAQLVADAALKAVAQADPTIVYLLTHTAAEIQTKITTDVIDLPTARTMLTRFALALAFVTRFYLR